MGNFFKRLIPKNIAGLLGLIQVLIPALREVVIVVIRIVAVFVPALEEKVEKVVGIFDLIESWYERIKNFFLGEDE